MQNPFQTPVNPILGPFYLFIFSLLTLSTYKHYFNFLTQTQYTKLVQCLIHFNVVKFYHREDGELLPPLTTPS